MDRFHRRLQALASQVVAAGSGGELQIRLQRRDAQGSASVTQEAWSPKQTAIIVCDMWNLHPCLNATRRGAELCPTMDRLLSSLRSNGATVIHAPSGCMDKYEGTPARQRAQSAPAVPNPPPGIDEWQYNSAGEPLGLGRGPRDRQGPNAEAEGCANGYPVDQRGNTGSVGDDTPAEHAAWCSVLKEAGLYPSPITHQTAALTIDHDRDYISDVGSEVWNVLESRGIVNVLLCGVHTNMCVLGRPFGLRQLSGLGKNVALLRDMTVRVHRTSIDHYSNAAHDVFDTGLASLLSSVRRAVVDRTLCTILRWLHTSTITKAIGGSGIILRVSELAFSSHVGFLKRPNTEIAEV